MSRRHAPALQAAKARHAAADPALQARLRASRKAWWTPERKAAWSARIRAAHAAGRYPPPPRCPWTPAQRAAQSARQRALWQAGRFEAARERWRAQARARWAAGRYAGNGARVKALWQAGGFDAANAHHRQLWRSGHWFGNRKWRGGIRAELRARFPEHAAWAATLTDADLAGLLSTFEERDRKTVSLDRRGAGRRTA